MSVGRAIASLRRRKKVKRAARRGSVRGMGIAAFVKHITKNK